MKHLKTVYILQTITFLFVLCLLAPVADAKIVFSIEGDIYVMNDDGSNRHRLTRNTLWKDKYDWRDLFPRWSPDGTKIAFIRQIHQRAQASAELFVMNADGTDLQRLTDDHASDGYPSWSPDGKSIAFDSNRNGRGQVYVIELATRTVTQLTGIEREEEGKLSSACPDWSSDGTQIIYQRFISNGPVAGLAHSNIWVMSANGEDQRPVFPDPKPGADVITLRHLPRWSADGKQFVFDDCKWNPEEQTCRFNVARIDGRKQIIQDIYNILGDKVLVEHFCWMENDRALLLSLTLTDKPAPNWDLYRYEFKTGSIRRLTQNPKDEGLPHWIEGALSVSPQDKLPTQWGEKKQNISQ